MVDITIAVVAKLTDLIIAPVARPFSNFWNYKSNLRNLEIEAGKLDAQRERLLHSIDDATRQGKEILLDAKHWLERSEMFITEASGVIDDMSRIKRGCKWLCPNLKMHYQLGKTASRLMKDAVKLREEGNFDTISYRTIPEEIWLQSKRGYEAFKSRNSTLNDILNKLCNPDINIVGLYGMAGVGKTTLVKEVARKAMTDKLFDVVIFAEVSHIPDVKAIQGGIADNLGLIFHEETLSGRATRLHYRLRKENRALLILDDVWDRLDLEAIGIQLRDDSGCKLLLTTRRRDVLGMMGSQCNFFINSLSEGESWSLFKKIAGDCVDLDDLQTVAIDVAKACAGVPIAIVTIARTLRSRSISEWKFVLQELRRSSFQNFKEVEASILLSYDHLRSKELRETFLLCSMMEYTDDASVGELLRYVMGLGLCQDIKTIEEAQDRVAGLVQMLKDSSLLLDSGSSERFSMHNLVRDVATSIASRDWHMFSMPKGSVRWDWADNERFNNCTLISLHDIKVLPTRFECPQLKFLHMKTGDPFLEVPNDFFRGILELRVLHLIGMNLLSLPTSLCLLVNLQTLCLDECKLQDVAVIGELKDLIILSFRGSDIEKLSGEIGQLTKLLLLDLSHCSKLKCITPNVISSLTCLEILCMGNTSIEWEVEGLYNERSNTSLDELKKLLHLTTLELHIQDAEMPKDLFFEKLKRYRIVIGDCNLYNKYETVRTLKLKLNSHFKDGFFMQLKGIEDLCLDEMAGVRNVLFELDRKGFPGLKHLQVQNNPHFLCIVESTQLVSCDVFPHLESLFLGNLINLRKICDGPLKEKYFFQLRILELQNCDKLKNIFTFSTVEGLLKLQEIRVTDCKSMEEIFAIESGEDGNNNGVIDKIRVNQLRSMTLEYLPQLTSFCSRPKNPSSLKRRQKPLEEKIDTSTPLFNEKAVFPNLEALKLSAISVERIWHNQVPATSSCAPNLTRLTMQGCRNLRYLFSSSIVNSFEQLQYLEICECTALEEIILVEELGEEEIKNFIFPQLSHLKLYYLENLRRFHSGGCIEFQSLKELEIDNCPELKAFIFNDTVGLPILEKMIISCMDNLKKIWHNQKFNSSFCNLKSLKVDDCQKLTTVIPSCNYAIMLESLTVKSCGSVEEIFDLKGLKFKGAMQLRELYIDHLPNLKKIWNEDPQGMLQFGKLQKVNVFLCPKLKNLFPAFVARSLSKLEFLQVSNCGVEEIVAKGGAEEEADRFPFPQLISLQLHCLPELRTFYPGIETVEVSFLKRLGLHYCDKMKIVTSEFHNSYETTEENQLDIPVQQPFFLVEKVFPNLEELQLSGKAITMAWQGQVPERLFGLLKSLELNDDTSTVLALGNIQRCHSLEKLSLNCGSYQEIFSYGDAEVHIGRLPQIKHLVLSGLYDLKRIWEQDSKVHFNFQKLETLKVRSCFNLINLMPSSASFKNLTTLEVWSCEGLINLITSSTANSLQQLEKMEIFDCKMMTQVVASEGTVTEEFIFRNLKSLSLVYLQSLTSFCSVNYILKFPVLENLVVNECPKMKLFSEGVTISPRLQKLELNWKAIDKCWGVDLNTTMKQ